MVFKNNIKVQKNIKAQIKLIVLIFFFFSLLLLHHCLFLLVPCCGYSLKTHHPRSCGSPLQNPHPPFLPWSNRLSPIQPMCKPASYHQSSSNRLSIRNVESQNAKMILQQALYLLFILQNCYSNSLQMKSCCSSSFY